MNDRAAQDRRAVLAANLAAVRSRIARACEHADRAASEVTLVVITKNFPASDVQILAELGVTDVGENRHPEAMHKRAECGELGLRWHFVGALQSNKAASVATYCDVVQSVDRHKLVPALAAAVGSAGREQLECFVQVSLDDPEAMGGRSGVPRAMLDGLVDAVSRAPELRLVGLMAVAPLGAPAPVAFAQLRQLHAQVMRAYPGADWLSAGMSADLEAAIQAGATHVRVGRAVLGERPRFE